MGGDLLLLHEVVAGAERVHEVHDLIDAGERITEGRSVRQVALDDLDVGRPRDTGETLRGTGEATHRETGSEQFGNEASSDVAGRSEHQDTTRSGHVVHRGSNVGCALRRGHVTSSTESRGVRWLRRTSA